MFKTAAPGMGQDDAHNEQAERIAKAAAQVEEQLHKAKTDAPRVGGMMATAASFVFNDQFKSVLKDSFGTTLIGLEVFRRNFMAEMKKENDAYGSGDNAARTMLQIIALSDQCDVPPKVSLALWYSPAVAHAKTFEEKAHLLIDMAAVYQEHGIEAIERYALANNYLAPGYGAHFSAPDVTDQPILQNIYATDLHLRGKAAPGAEFAPQDANRPVAMMAFCDPGTDWNGAFLFMQEQLAGLGKSYNLAICEVGQRGDMRPDDEALARTLHAGRMPSDPAAPPSAPLYDLGVYLGHGASELTQMGTHPSLFTGRFWGNLVNGINPLSQSALELDTHDPSRATAPPNMLSTVFMPDALIIADSCSNGFGYTPVEEKWVQAVMKKDAVLGPVVNGAQTYLFPGPSGQKQADDASATLESIDRMYGGNVRVRYTPPGQAVPQATILPAPAPVAGYAQDAPISMPLMAEWTDRTRQPGMAMYDVRSVNSPQTVSKPLMIGFWSDNVDETKEFVSKNKIARDLDLQLGDKIKLSDGTVLALTKEDQETLVSYRRTVELEASGNRYRLSMYNNRLEIHKAYEFPMDVKYIPHAGSIHIIYPPDDPSQLVITGKLDVQISWPSNANQFTSHDDVVRAINEQISGANSKLRITDIRNLDSGADRFSIDFVSIQRAPTKVDEVTGETFSIKLPGSQTDLLQVQGRGWQPQELPAQTPTGSNIDAYGKLSGRIVMAPNQVAGLKGFVFDSKGRVSDVDYRAGDFNPRPFVPPEFDWDMFDYSAFMGGGTPPPRQVEPIWGQKDKTKTLKVGLGSTFLSGPGIELGQKGALSAQDKISVMASGLALLNSNADPAELNQKLDAMQNDASASIAAIIKDNPRAAGMDEKSYLGLLMQKAKDKTWTEGDVSLAPYFGSKSFDFILLPSLEEQIAKQALDAGGQGRAKGRMAGTFAAIAAPDQASARMLVSENAEALELLLKSYGAKGVSLQNIALGPLGMDIYLGMEGKTKFANLPLTLTNTFGAIADFGMEFNGRLTKYDGLTYDINTHLMAGVLAPTKSAALQAQVKGESAYMATLQLGSSAGIIPVGMLHSDLSLRYQFDRPTSDTRVAGTLGTRLDMAPGMLVHMLPSSVFGDRNEFLKTAQAFDTSFMPTISPYADLLLNFEKFALDLQVRGGGLPSKFRISNVEISAGQAIPVGPGALKLSAKADIHGMTGYSQSSVVNSADLMAGYDYPITLSMLGADSLPGTMHVEMGWSGSSVTTTALEQRTAAGVAGPHAQVGISVNFK